jgi:tRNA A-37 threonylcarbamoyl transferase component Bud32
MITMDDETKKVLMSDELIDCEVTIRQTKYHLVEVAGAGYKSVVWKGLDEWQNSVAVKFTIPADYGDRSFLQEANRANKLRGYASFAQFIDADVVELPSVQGMKKFVCFIEDWIDGPTLRDFLQQRQIIPTDFLIQFIRTMCEALNVLKTKGLCHDDLHANNIKIAKPKAGLLSEDELEVVIIDTGSLKPPPSKKEKDDHQWFVQHIVDVRNAILRKKRFYRYERLFLEEVIPLLNRMLDEDRMIALRDPSKIKEQFDLTWKRCRDPSEEREQGLDDPFHYISAETISSDKLLVELFAESCPWKQDVLGPDPIVLTGPRGCGKSTIFRRMSLRGMLFKGIEEVKGSNIAGFYISCSTDLRNHVSWMRSKNLVRRFNNEIRHYFNLLLTREIVNTFSIISTRNDKENLFGFGFAEEKRLYEFIVKKLDVTESESLRLQGVPPMVQALELIDNEMETCHASIVNGIQMPRTTHASYISDLTNFLSKNIVYLRQRKIVFFVDDLSTRQIPEDVQNALNDILFERARNHVFKISSDKYGWSSLDTLESTGDKTREIREVDCAKFYLVEADDDTKREFTRDLLAKRLKMAGYEGSPEEIIGHSKYAEGSIGKAIRYRAQGKNLNNVYHGLETITELCCGDISVLLEIYRQIFRRGRVTKVTKELVSAHLQHEAITSVSRDLCRYIKSYHPYGDKMYSIATHFGTLSRLILQEGKPHRQKDKMVDPETTRIEVDEDPSKPTLNLNTEQGEITRELVKRAIFIELDLGRTRRGFFPSLRWQLRPALCPTFLTTPSKNIAIKWTLEGFRFFLSNPKEACVHEFEKWRKSDSPAKLADFNMENDAKE